ncbi:MAG: hypothetical protein HY717_12680 [Planctomycetes bacterium]|nr:hypothetical protein [Planctomycetota bacterium]
MEPRFDPFKICQNLRCKEMMASGNNSEYEREKLFDDFDAVAYWCACTQTGRGPDGQRVHRKECSVGTRRNCFVGIESLT